jgi:phosphoribosylaminoimidazole-succinocarboxamide synthase
MVENSCLTFSRIFAIMNRNDGRVLALMRRQTQSLLVDTAGKGAKFEKREPLYERPGKILYRSEKPDLLIQVYTSTGSSENGKQHSIARSAHTVRNEISAYLFEYLEGFHIPTHFLNRLSENEMLVRHVETLPLAVQVYNTCNAMLTKRFTLAEGAALEFPVVEHFYTNGNSTPTWVNEYHLAALGIASPEEFRQINRIASKANAVLRGLCERRQLTLTEMRLEFGRARGQIFLADELSPLTCQFLDMTAGNKQGRERFLYNELNGEAAMVELCDRLKLTV